MGRCGVAPCAGEIWHGRRRRRSSGPCGDDPRFAAHFPAILDAGGGAIVNVSSVFAHRGGPAPDYSNAKHAIRALTRTAAKEYADRGIRINNL
ncbi:hypothetical protein GCM10010469_35050 [Streptomyces labedae]|uniref:Uncharacterized protein n=2 Tax=Streptomyces TaxID=1883 RepID=A0ABQ2U3Q3_9ACTN|nr:hypothetical protein GCM10010265_58910 [Streptomyces griseoincarnatus]GGT58714.1 hypothetical protein GCM10010287_36090 [Streptomyces variabilis]